MAPNYSSVWAIDIGSTSLKALHLREVDGVVEVVGFDNIAHSKILSADGMDATERDELIAMSLRQFVSKNDVTKSAIVVSVSSNNSFARFVKLPPVEPKRIPEIVKFEAAQQIPFDINEVQWDWQLMEDETSPETKVGLFAIKTEIANSLLDFFAAENLNVQFVQMAGMALYNYAIFDRDELKNKRDALVVLDIGAENTDLVVCTKTTVWQRSIPIGGNTFTKAIADTFKLNFQKAEKLKRTAPMSKYARQVLQAMKPVFVDLSSEIQRSLGFYGNSNPENKILGVIALGGGTQMRGLVKYLQQSLQMPVERPDSFKKITMGSEVPVAKFHDNVCLFGVVYGLAIQGLGLGKIESNLLPKNIARTMAWSSKSKYFIAAGVILLIASVLSFARTIFDKANYANNNNARQNINMIINSTEDGIEKLKQEQDKGPVLEEKIEKYFNIFKDRQVIAKLHEVIIDALPNEKNNPEQASMYEAFKNSDVETLIQTPRKERKQLFITTLEVRYVDDCNTATLDTQWVPEQRVTGITSVPMPYPEDTIADVNEANEPPKDGPGFVVFMEGYSTYKDIRELMDPIGIGDDMSKWGFLTRLANLYKLTDGNSPFVLYKKGNIQHFEYEDGVVDFDSKDMPEGIGIESSREIAVSTTKSTSKETILIDPMTREIIGKIAVVDDDGKDKVDARSQKIYEINDHWFRIKAKFLWIDAAKRQKEELNSGQDWNQ